MSEQAAAARRARAPGWRDPRIAAGVTVMAVSVLVGGWAFSSKDEAITVLALRHDVKAGSTITGSDVTRERVRLGDGPASRYVVAGAGLPARSVASRDLAAGELLPRSAFARPKAADRVEVPLAVEPANLPESVATGGTVDVWVVAAAEGDRGGAPARRVFADVTVLRIAAGGDGLAPQQVRQVIVAVPAEPSAVTDARGAATVGPAAGEGLAAALGRIAAGRVVLTRKG